MTYSFTEALYPKYGQLPDIDERVVVVTLSGGIKFSTYTDKVRGRKRLDSPEFKLGGDKFYSRMGIHCWFRLIKTTP